MKGHDNEDFHRGSSLKKMMRRTVILSANQKTAGLTLKQLKVTNNGFDFVPAVLL